MLRPLTPEFQFAGFTFPRYIADLPARRLWQSPAWTQAQRLECLRKRREGRKICGPYFHAPTPNGKGPRGFYLDANGNAGDGAPVARLAWDRTHWWACDPEGMTKFHPLVAMLPHGRYLTGWTMGEHMCATVGTEVYTDESDAWAAARSEAESAADAEADYIASLPSEDD
jgi:hypothetical protein